MVKNEEKITEKKVKKWIERAIRKFENMDCGKTKVIKKHTGGSCGGVWFFGFIGAAVYFLQDAATFGVVVVGLLKAIVWPAFVIYNLLNFLKL